MNNNQQELFTELTPSEGAAVSGGTYLVKLHSIEAIRMNEYWADEPFINIGAKKVWSGKGFRNGTTHTFPQDDGAIVEVFGSSTTMRLYEEDLGYWPDKHDYMGEWKVTGSQAGKGLQTASFTKNGHYEVKYEVINI